MSIRDYKITDAQIAEKGVIASPDTLTGTADENKRVFDRLVRECVAPQFNEIVETFADMEDSTTEWSGEEAKRQQAEQGRVSAESARVSAETARQHAESARVSAETARQHAESARATAETARANAENKRDTAEKSRAAAETGRVNAESARVTAESQRANAESVRAQNEAARISAETGRADAEADRVSAEDTRIANENARKSAETDRASAETVRESGENARKSAEKARASAEQQRESAESTRQTNETARVSAEKSRAAAETARQTAEKARNLWEEYSAGKAYVPGNKVSFNGSSYVCTAATTGHAPTDTAYWLLIAQKGTDGKGAGDMLASVYDPKGKSQDVFAYTDQKISAHNTATDAHADKFAEYLPLSGGEMTGPIFAPETKELAVGYGSNTTGYATYKLTRFIHTLSSAGGGTVSSVIIDPERIRLENGNFHLSVGLAGVEVSNPLRMGLGSGSQVPNLDYVDALKTKAHKVTLTVTGWNSSTKQQTVSVADVVADETAQLILPMPAAASMTAYNDAGSQCTAQAAGKLTFQCETVPTASIDVYVTVTPVAFS